MIELIWNGVFKAVGANGWHGLWCVVEERWPIVVRSIISMALGVLLGNLCTDRSIEAAVRTKDTQSIIWSSSPWAWSRGAKCWSILWARAGHHVEQAYESISGSPLPKYSSDMNPVESLRARACICLNGNSIFSYFRGQRHCYDSSSLNWQNELCTLGIPKITGMRARSWCQCSCFKLSSCSGSWLHCEGWKLVTIDIFVICITISGLIAEQDSWEERTKRRYICCYYADILLESVEPVSFVLVLEIRGWREKLIKIKGEVLQCWDPQICKIECEIGSAY
jgi:hypothetical protein